MQPPHDPIRLTRRLRASLDRRCHVCDEVRPVVHRTLPLEETLGEERPLHRAEVVKLKPWQVRPDGAAWEAHRQLLYVCARCEAHRRSAKRDRCGLFTGVNTTLDLDLGPADDPIRHNSMHFLPVPPFLRDLTDVEKTMIARIIPVMRIQRLGKGNLSSSGFCSSIPNDMFAKATALPRLGSELSHLILVKKQQEQRGRVRVSTHRAFHVRRSVLQAALEGLCYGEPPGGVASPPAPQPPYRHPWTRYDGPDRADMALHGRWFVYEPNRYYADAVISRSRLAQVPVGGTPADLPVHETAAAAMDDEEEGGPVPAKGEVPAALDDDQTVHHTGIVCPTSSRDTAAEVRRTASS